MKTHKPWTVGVCTYRSNNAIFCPVGYDKTFNRWYGYVMQVVNNEIEKVPAWRSGTTKRYKIISKGHMLLSKDHPIHSWLKIMTYKKKLTND